MRYYCTFFDRNYLAKALALLGSLKKHESSPYKVIVVCLDEITRLLLSRLSLPNVELIPLHVIEAGDPMLGSARRTRQLVEYYWTLTSNVIHKIMSSYPEIDLLTYLDADLFFYSSPDPIFRELGESSILIHEHRFSPSLAVLEINGKYNVGLVSFRRDENGMTALSWWRDRCNEWCFDRCEDGKMGDQKYLDDWPDRFKGVRVLQHIGAGLGPWNHEQYVFTGTGGKPLVNGLPVVFYHFHALTQVSRQVFLPSKHAHYPITESVLRYCYLPYFHELSKATLDLINIQPSFTEGLSDTVPKDFLFAAHIDVNVKFDESTGLYDLLELDPEWRCFIPRHRRQLIILGTSQAKEQAPATLEADENKRSEEIMLNKKGEELFSQGRLDDAHKIFADVTRRFPDYAVANSNLGVVLNAKGDLENAFKCFIRALEADPQSETALFNAFDMIDECKEPAYETLEKLAYAYLDEHLFDRQVISRLVSMQEKMYSNWLLKSEIIDASYRKKPYLISAIVSTYKSEEFMQECLTDLTGQTLGDNLEIIIVDANSPQNERKIVTEFQKRFSNIRYIRTCERIGIYPAWNFGIYLASSDLVTPFSTNDRLRPDAYEIMVRYMQSHPNTALVYGDTFLTDLPHQSFHNFVPKKNLMAFRWPPFNYEQLLFNCLIGPHPVWKKSLCHDVGYVDPRYTAISDQDYWLRIGRSHTIEHIQEYTGLQWLSDDSLSGRAIGKMEIFDVQRKYQKLWLKEKNIEYPQQQLDFMLWLLIAILIRLIEERYIKEALAFWDRHNDSFPNVPRMKEMAEMIKRLRKMNVKNK